MNGRLRTTLLVGLVGGGVLGLAGPAGAKQTTVGPTVTKQGPPPSSPTKPDEDEIVEVATPDSGKVSRSAPLDTTLQARLEHALADDTALLEHVLAQDEAAAVAHFGLPDSGNMPTVVAPDLSNLPPGETAVDPETGEEFTKN